MPEAATPNRANASVETGTDESLQDPNATGSEAHNENQRVTYANIKRTYMCTQGSGHPGRRASSLIRTDPT